MNFGDWETEHYNSVLELTSLCSSFLVKHKSEPDNYVGLSPALNLQLVTKVEKMYLRVGHWILNYINLLATNIKAC